MTAMQRPGQLNAAVLKRGTLSDETRGNAWEFLMLTALDAAIAPLAPAAESLA